MIKKDKVKNLHYILNGRLEAAEIEKVSDEVLGKYGEKAKMPGFRPGHVPLNVLKAKYGQDAWADAVNKAIQSDMEKFIDEKKLRLADNPKLDLADKEIKMGEAVEYSLEFDVLPELPKIDLEKITLVREVADVPESEIEKALANLAKARAQFEVAEGKAAAKGDVAVIDFKGFVGDDAFEGGEAKKHHLELGSGQFIPGFEDQVIGHKAGDKFDVNVKFPDGYGAANLAGKNARFEIVLHEVRAPSEPEINDELAKAVGQENVAGLRDHIKKILAEQYEIGAAQQMKNELLEILADKVKMELPETLVEKEVALAREEKPEMSEKDARREAEKRVKLGLILSAWGEAENISVSKDEVQQAVFSEAYRSGANPQQVLEYYQSNPSALSMMRGVLFERKVLDAMVAKTAKKDKKVEAAELFKQK